MYHAPAGTRPPRSSCRPLRPMLPPTLRKRPPTLEEEIHREDRHPQGRRGAHRDRRSVSRADPLGAPPRPRAQV